MKDVYYAPWALGHSGLNRYSSFEFRASGDRDFALGVEEVKVVGGKADGH